MPASFFPSDPDENAAALSNLAEVVFACLEAAEARAVVEIGAFHGKSTGALLEWAERSGAVVTAIDPTPQPDLRALAERRPELELIEATSLEALVRIERADAIIVDGDHNYYTLSHELELISGRWEGESLPLLLLHDIGWPLARRDAYYAPERIPPEHRQPLVHHTHLLLDDPATAEEGMPFACVAAREGGPRNGILTAVEDFLAERGELRFARVPAFFGLGAIWHPQARWADAVERALEPWADNPVLERLEANRVRQMVERYRMTRRLERVVDAGEESRELLAAMADSRAFTVAEQLSRLHGRGRPAFSRERLRRALDDG